jgi:DNA recombination protein RmuC
MADATSALAAIEPPVIVAAVTLLLLGLGLGWLWGRLSQQPKVLHLSAESASLKMALELEKQSGAEKVQALKMARRELADAFAVLANRALRDSSEEFLRLAQESLKQFHVHAQGELSQKELAITNLLHPIREALNKTEAQIHAIEKERKEAYGSITRHLESLAKTQQALHGETRNLVQALRRPEVRGQWGELTLKRLAELSGMVEHCDFFPQHTAAGEAATIRPDMLIRLPARRDIVVDVKTPLDAYLSAVDAKDEHIRGQFLAKHAQNLRARVRELASKAYWSQFPDSPEFVVLFIPGDQFLSAALDADQSLLEDALAQKVILATPASLVALLRAVAYGWQQQTLTEHAREVQEVGAELYRRMATFSEHFARLGKHLTSSVEAFNKTVGSYDRSLVPGARRFAEMGISPKRPLEDVTTVEGTPRTVETNASEVAASTASSA